jgi:hypothetical protein
MAEAGAIPEAKLLVRMIVGSNEASTRNKAVDRFAAEFAVWTRDPAADALLARVGFASASGAATKPTPVVTYEELDFYQRLAHAFARNDQDPARALAAAEKTRGASKTLAMFDVMAFEARVGQANVAVAQFKKLTPEFSVKGAERLAQGWAQAKDTSGITSWIDSLPSPLLKYFAEIGVVEGALHTHVRDPYDGPPSPLSL